MNEITMPPMADQAQAAALKNNVISMIYLNDCAEKSQSSLVASAIEVLLKRYGLKSHVETIHQRAEGIDGILVVASFGQDPHSGQDLCPVIAHFKPGQKTEMSEWIKKYSNQKDRNIYMPLVLMSSELQLGKKGGEADIVAVLGLVADFDDADAMNWLERIPLQPSYVLETSPGRYQVGFFFNRAVSPEEAKRIAKALKVYCNCDHGTADISHVWRIPETLNWPNKKKLDEGRDPEPWEVRAVDNEQALVDPDELWKILKNSVKNSSLKIVAQAQISNHDEYIDSLPISLSTKKLIQEGAEVGKRSEAMMKVLCALAGAGVSEENIFDIFEEFPIGDKYHEKGKSRQEWLRPQIEKARKKVARTSTEDVIIAINNLLATGSLTTEQWTEQLHSANLSSSEIDQVLTHLVTRGVGNKAGLKAVWKERKKELDIQATRQRRIRAVAEISENKKSIKWDPNNLNEMVKEVEEGILAYPGEWPYVMYASRLCFVTNSSPAEGHAIDSPQDKPPVVPLLKHYCYNLLLLRIEQSVYFYKEKGEGPEQIPVPHILPGMLLDYPSSKAPETKGLITHPIVTSTGAYINQEGYDAQTQLYLALGEKTFPPLEAGGQRQAREAFKSIEQNMFSEFEWEDKIIDAAIAVVIFITTLLRKLCDIAPGFLVKANLQGSGKTTLLRIIHIVVTGHDMPVSTLSENSEEVRKSMLAHLMESASMICFDNVPDGFEVRSEILATVMTSSIFRDRLLGSTKQVSVPTNSTIAITGNNISMDADLVRRFIPLSLQPKELLPEKRSFKHQDIAVWSRSIRIDMIQKGLSIVSRYLNAESPLSKENLPSSGFPMWDKMVRFPILWASGVDVIEAVDKARLSSNDLVTRNAAIVALFACFPKFIEFTASDVFNIIQQPIDDAACQLRDAFLELSSKTVKSSASVGWALKKLLDYPSADGTLKKRNESNKHKYFVELPK